MKLSWQGKHVRAVYQALIAGGIFILATGLVINTFTPHLVVPQWSYFLLAFSWLLIPLSALMYSPIERHLYPLMHLLYWIAYAYVGWVCAVNHFNSHLAMIWLLSLVTIGIQYSAKGHLWVSSLVLVTVAIFGMNWSNKGIWQVNAEVFMCLMGVAHAFLLIYTTLFQATLRQLTNGNLVVQSLLDSSESGQLILGEHTSVIYHNASMLELARTFCPSESHLIASVQKLTGQTAEALRQRAQAFPLGQSYTFTHTVQTPAGKESHLRIRLARLKAGAEEWLLVKFADISAQTQLETRLKAKTDELEQLVYRSSHDLKGPIASILGLTTVAKDTPGQTPAGAQYLSLIERVARRLDDTISSLAEASQMQAGEPALQPIHLEPMLYSLVDQLQIRPEGQEVHFALHVQEPVLFVSDRMMVESLLRHLLHNAVAYRRPGVIHEVQIAVSQMPGVLEIRVQDNGTGIPAHLRERIFEIFYKGNSNSTGAGLGLYIVKNAVDKLNGVCEFESEEGRGTTFRVRLPRKSSALG